MKQLGPLERRQLAKRPGMIECIACGGSGAASRGGTCKPCQGSGSLRDGVSVAVEGNNPVFLPQHSSATAEHYTPADIVARAHATLGGIDLDPASCALAQTTVDAAVWYGPGSPHGEDGLTEPWGGRVFLNPPGGKIAPEHRGKGTRSNAALWWARLATAWDTGEIEAAVFVGFTLEILRSAQGLDCPQPLDMPLCIPSKRIAFDTPSEGGGGELVSGTSPTHANVIVLLPNRGDEGASVIAFRDAFESLGRVRS